MPRALSILQLEEEPPPTGPTMSPTTPLMSTCFRQESWSPSTSRASRDKGSRRRRSKGRPPETGWSSSSSAIWKTAATDPKGSSASRRSTPMRTACSTMLIIVPIIPIPPRRTMMEMGSAMNATIASLPPTPTRRMKMKTDWVMSATREDLSARFTLSAPFAETEIPTRSFPMPSTC